MTIEMQALLVVTAVLLASLGVQGGLAPATHGFRWGLGPRDEPRPPSMLQGRMNRIVANTIEGMVLFIPLVFIAYATGISTPLTQTGAVLFAAARIGFAIVYAIGIPVLRSVVWGVGLVGLLMMAFDLVRATPAASGAP